MTKVTTSVSISAMSEKELPVRYTLHRENTASPIMIILGECEVYLHLNIKDAGNLTDCIREAVWELKNLGTKEEEGE